MPEIVDSYPRGSLVKVSYVVEEGSLVGPPPAQAYIRKISQGNRRELVAEDPVAVAMTTTYRAATVDLAEGYDCSLSGGQSSALTVGNYAVDIKIDGQDITETVLIHIHEAASSRPS